MDRSDLAEFVRLESEVWDALVRGDAEADRRMLSDDFVGVYPSGFAGKADHAEPLAGGPTVASYELFDARILVVSGEAVMLSYRAEYRRPSAGDSIVETMFVSSLWCVRDGRWLNVFSQDTPVGPATV